MDENGEWIHLVIGAVVGGVANVISNWKTIKEKGFWIGVGYFGVGAVAGALSAGVGAGISSALPVMGATSGGFAAGFLGTSAATTAATSFISGAAIGAGAGGAGGFVTGFGNVLLGGEKNLGKAFGQGLLYSLAGAASGALVGGLWGGIDAAIDGRRFFDGAKVTKGFAADVNVTAVMQKGKNNCLPASGESVNKSLGGNIDQAQLRSWAGGDAELNPLNEEYFWKDVFESKMPFNVRGVNGTSKLNDIVSTLNGGGRVTVGVAGSGNVGHSVVVKSVYLQTVQKVNGSISRTVMYRVMDPGTGTFMNIPFSKIIGNVWHIKP